MCNLSVFGLVRGKFPELFAHAQTVDMLSRVMSHHGRGSRPCPLCDAAALQSTVLDHILEHHRGELFLEPELDANQLLTLLEQLHLNILGRFRNLYV